MIKVLDKPYVVHPPGTPSPRRGGVVFHIWLVQQRTGWIACCPQMRILGYVQGKSRDDVLYLLRHEVSALVAACKTKKLAVPWNPANERPPVGAEVRTLRII